jgi:hypothetical protein
MKRINQTKFGPLEGNCFAACLASLLELPIEDVNIETGDNHWLESVQEFLRKRNLFYLEVRLDVAVHYPLYALHGVYCIFTGRSPRTFDVPDVNHSVIGRLDMDGEGQVIYNLVHDPHPACTFLKEGTLFGLGFLCKLNPAKP